MPFVPGVDSDIEVENPLVYIICTLNVQYNSINILWKKNSSRYPLRKLSRAWLASMAKHNFSIFFSSTLNFVPIHHEWVIIHLCVDECTRTIKKHFWVFLMQEGSFKIFLFVTKSWKYHKNFRINLNFFMLIYKANFHTCQFAENFFPLRSAIFNRVAFGFKNFHTQSAFRWLKQHIINKFNRVCKERARGFKLSLISELVFAFYLPLCITSRMQWMYLWKLLMKHDLSARQFSELYCSYFYFCLPKIIYFLLKC